MGKAAKPWGPDGVSPRDPSSVQTSPELGCVQALKAGVDQHMPAGALV